MISVIIPTWNEGAYLGKTLQLLAENKTPHEIIVSDAGSQDATVQAATQYAAKVVSAPLRGRGVQMNSGAQIAVGEILFFLHADTQVTSTSLYQIETALQDRAMVGGGFARRFDSPSLFLKFTCGLATLRCRRLGWFLGDQGMFVRRTIFEQLHRFKEQAVFEDLDFSRRLARRGKVATLSPGVLSSSRRFTRRGPWRTTCADFWLTCRYLAGIYPQPPEP